METFFRLTKMGFDGVCEGIAACSEPDHDGEILDYEGSLPYFRAWSSTQFANSGGKSYGNVRIQHDAKRVGGLLTGIQFDDTNRQIKVSAQILDPTAKQMLQAGALTGFSIGGSYVSKTPLPGGLVSYVANPVEISVVDRPCSPSATFSLVHSDGRVELRKFLDRSNSSELMRVAQGLLDSGHPLWEVTSALNLSLSIRKQLRTRALTKQQGLTAQRLAIRKSRGWQD